MPLVNLKSLDSLNSTPQNMIMSEIAWWELRRLFPARSETPARLSVNVSEVLDLTLDDLWADVTATAYSQKWDLMWAANRTLIEYLAETYGPDVIPTLLDNLAQAGDIDQWLRASTGQGTDEIEPAWRSWVWATYGAHDDE